MVFHVFFRAASAADFCQLNHDRLFGRDMRTGGQAQYLYGEKAFSWLRNVESVVCGVFGDST